MKRWGLLLALALAAASSAMEAAAADVPELKCDIGPVARQFGETDWLVYSCEDKKSLVVVTAPQNPARPFYFFYLYSSKGYALHGEGTGDKNVTDKASDDLKALTEEQIALLLSDTQKASIHK